jgi:carbonic anhydrase
MKSRRVGRYLSLSAFALALVLVAWAEAQQENGKDASHDGAAPRGGAPAKHGAPHWTYEGEAGPAAWGALVPEFATCSAGRHQSPLDLPGTLPPAKADSRAAFPPAELAVSSAARLGDAVHNGHTIQVDFPGGDTLTVGGVPFELVQFHFHAPSEHTVAGQHFPVEIHFVHRSQAGKLAVVGVLVEPGAANPEFERFASQLPGSEGAISHLAATSPSVSGLLPKSHAIDRYDGSLTTPPCSEQVSWFVMTAPIEFSAVQIAALEAALPDNSRPVQPANGRAIVSDELAFTSAPAR